MGNKRARKLKGFPTLNKGQNEALDLFDDWFKNGGYKKKPILRIGGAAGSGKSVLINVIRALYDLDETSCYVVAYTGQAVSVLRRRGVHAKTIHSTFMHTTQVPLRDDKNRIIKKDGIPLMTFKFKPLECIPSNVELIICDEYSFVPEELQKMMLKFHVPILAVGDPFQLPPVAGKQCFAMEDLDYILTEVMRQDKDNEILKLATCIREREPIYFSDYGNQVVFANPKSTVEETFQAFRACFQYTDITITTTNKQRQIITDCYRREVVKTDSPYPVKGERMICRRNDWQLRIGDIPLTNGMMGICMEDIPRSDIKRKDGVYYMDFKPLYVANNYFDKLMCNHKFLLDRFGDKTITKFDRGHMIEFGWAITTHLSQGAEFNTVTFMDTYNRDEDYMSRLRYTAVTRATDHLVYVLPYPI